MAVLDWHWKHSLAVGGLPRANVVVSTVQGVVDYRVLIWRLCRGGRADWFEVVGTDSIVADNAAEEAAADTGFVVAVGIRSVGLVVVGVLQRVKRAVDRYVRVSGLEPIAVAAAARRRDYHSSWPTEDFGHLRVPAVDVVVVKRSRSAVARSDRPEIASVASVRVVASKDWVLATLRIGSTALAPMDLMVQKSVIALAAETGLSRSHYSAEAVVYAHYMGSHHSLLVGLADTDLSDAHSYKAVPETVAGTSVVLERCSVKGLELVEVSAGPADCTSSELVH